MWDEWRNQDWEVQLDVYMTMSQSETRTVLDILSLIQNHRDSFDERVCTADPVKCYAKFFLARVLSGKLVEFL